MMFDHHQEFKFILDLCKEWDIRTSHGGMYDYLKRNPKGPYSIYAITTNQYLEVALFIIRAPHNHKRYNLARFFRGGAVHWPTIKGQHLEASIANQDKAYSLFAQIKHRFENAETKCP